MLSRPLMSPAGRVPAAGMDGHVDGRADRAVRNADTVAEARALPVLVMPMALAAAVEATLPLGFALGERLGAHVHLVHVLGADEAPRSPTSEARREQQARLRLDAMRMLYRYALPGRAPVPVTPVVLPPTPLGDALAAYVRTVDAALVLAPAYGHRPAPDGRLTPHVAALVGALPCPVLIVPPGRSLGSLDRLIVSEPGAAGAGALRRGLGAVDVADALGLPTVPATSPPTATDLTWVSPSALQSDVR